jgi:hypothetical protein
MRELEARPKQTEVKELSSDEDLLRFFDTFYRVNGKSLSPQERAERSFAELQIEKTQKQLEGIETHYFGIEEKGVLVSVGRIMEKTRDNGKKWAYFTDLATLTDAEKAKT